METLEERNCVSPTLFYTDRYQKFFLQVARFIAKQGGMLTHAEDIYHDALIAYYEKSIQRDFVLKTTEDAYIMGIVKNLWRQKIKDELKAAPIADNLELTDEKSPVVDQRKLYAIVLSSGKKCLDLLAMFYQQQSPLLDIAKTLGFGSERSVSVQKYKCLEKIRATVQLNSLSHEDFLE